MSRFGRRTPTPSYQTYSATYLTKTFVELIESLGRIEDELENDAAFQVLQLLEDAQAEVKGDVYVLDGLYLKLSVDRPDRSRRLDVRITDLNFEKSTKYKSSTITINSFGAVVEIDLSLPAKLSALEGPLQTALRRVYASAYLALRNAYVSAYGQWISELFTTVYAVINTELELAAHKELKDRFWFSISNASSETFRYHFSAQNLETAIDWFVKHQNAVLSPCTATVLLITTDVTDGFLTSAPALSKIKVNDSTHIIEFADLPTLGNETSFWLAERSLFGSKALAAIHVVDLGDVIFELNCPVDNLPALSDCMKEVAVDLDIIIRERFTSFRKDQQRLRKALARASDGASALRDVGTDIIAKFLAELAQG